MVAAAVDEDVRVDVAGDRVHDADPVAAVLEHSRLLDVQLDPACEPVQHRGALAPARRLVARRLCMLPKAATVVGGAKPLSQVLLGDPLRDDPAAEQHLAEARALFLEKRDQLQRQAEAELLVQAADLECRDDAHGAVVLATVPVRVTVRADTERRLATRPVATDERPDGVFRHREADALQLAGEVVERVPVHRRVGVTADRFARERVLRRCEMLDVALDPRGTPLTVDHAGDCHRVTLVMWPVMLRGSWEASTKRCKDEGAVHKVVESRDGNGELA